MLTSAGGGRLIPLSKQQILWEAVYLPVGEMFDDSSLRVCRSFLTRVEL